jgi:hypothetical protein
VYRGTLAELAAQARSDREFRARRESPWWWTARQRRAADDAARSNSTTLTCLLTELAPSKARAWPRKLTGAKRNDAYAARARARASRRPAAPHARRSMP